MIPTPASTLEILAVAVGNTRTRLGRFRGRDLHDPLSFPNTSPADILRHAETLLESAHDCPIVIASVNNAFADTLMTSLVDETGQEIYRIGRDLGVPLKHALDDATTVGQDRLLNCLAAFRRAQQACVVVDAGTAITVDFVDGQGTFQGGVIAPGLSMMLRSLHEHTAALPQLEFAPPDPVRGPFGKDTRHAMILGVINAARGLVRNTVELYAESFGAYPQIVATGGDAPALFDNDPIVEHIVPDLQLVGIAEAAATALGDSGADDAPDSDDE